MDEWDLDLGSGRMARFTNWSPDRALNPQYAGVPDIERYGLHVHHEGGCDGFVTFDSEVARRFEPNTPRWTVESWEPLTLSPSILSQGCCHGFIREGKWVDG